MSILNRIKRGTAGIALRFVIAGPEGVGKSTIGSKAPQPLFICAEDGLTGLDHVQRFVPESLADLSTLLDAMIASENPVTEFSCKTIVVDTADWLERLICKSICIRDEQPNIEGYGFGKGYVIMENELVNLLAKFDVLRTKGITIIMLSHVHIKTFNDPRGESYERFEMKGHKRFTGILREWPDACLFATPEVFTKKVQGGKRDKTIAGERVMHTTWSPAWDAKNRLNLPESIPLEWDALEQAIKDNSPDALRAQIKALFTTAKLDEASKASWTKWLTKIDSVSADKLKSAIEKLTEKQ